MDLNDYPTTRSILWKPVVAIAGAVVVLLVLVGVVLRLVSGGLDEGEIVQEQALQRQAEDAIESCEGQEACEAQARKEAAQVTGQSSYCEEIEDTVARDDCFWGLAREVLDVSYCDGVSDAQDQVRCQDSVYLQQAYAQDDVTICQQLSREISAQGCIEAIEGSPDSAAECDPAVHGIDRCTFLEVTEQAVAASDRSLCDVLDGEYLFTCQTRVTPDDPDLDNLSDLDEERYGTDPFDPDTDGDGYTDGGEVAAGYDPNGSGKFE